MPVDGVTFCTVSQPLIPQHCLVHEDDFLLFKDDERSRSSWRGVQNCVDFSEEVDMYVRYKGWYHFFDGRKYCWFDRLTKAMLAHDYHFSEEEPLTDGDHHITLCRKDDYNFPYKLKCYMPDY